jgi:hypothetical protein
LEKNNFGWLSSFEDCPERFPEISASENSKIGIRTGDLKIKGSDKHDNRDHPALSRNHAAPPSDSIYALITTIKVAKPNGPLL